jgi:hypothetical protein
MAFPDRYSFHNEEWVATTCAVSDTTQCLSTALTEQSDDAVRKLHAREWSFAVVRIYCQGMASSMASVWEGTCKYRKHSFILSTIVFVTTASAHHRVCQRLVM